MTEKNWHLEVVSLLLVVKILWWVGCVLMFIQKGRWMVHGYQKIEKNKWGFVWWTRANFGGTPATFHKIINNKKNFWNTKKLKFNLNPRTRRSRIDELHEGRVLFDRNGPVRVGSFNCNMF